VADNSCLGQFGEMSLTPEFPMPKSPADTDRVPLSELISDPVVQTLMKADNVTDQELTELIRMIESKQKITLTKTDTMAEPPHPSGGYRPGVGIMLLNRNNRVFVGRRHKPKDAGWQMPQGGIDEGETPRAAALRELHEETGVVDPEILAESRVWLCYELPEELLGKAWNGRWRGQRQKWFAMRFKGSDADIKIDRHEFDDWKWVRMAELPDLIVPFKRQVYISVLSEFHDAVAR
jgi:putative (di)nucleoside polyphosphate hydrolase